MPQLSMEQEIRAGNPARTAIITDAARRATELMEFFIEHDIGPGRFELPGRGGLLWTGDRSQH